MLSLLAWLYSLSSLARKREGPGQRKGRFESSGGKPDMLVQEVPPGQECLSSWEALKIYHFKRYTLKVYHLLNGASHKKAKRKRDIIPFICFSNYK